MGNQITAIAPAQILPLENYFNDLTDYGKPNRSASMVEPCGPRLLSNTHLLIQLQFPPPPNIPSLIICALLIHVIDNSVLVWEAQDSSR